MGICILLRRLIRYPRQASSQRCANAQAAQIFRTLKMQKILRTSQSTRKQRKNPCLPCAEAMFVHPQGFRTDLQPGSSVHCLKTCPEGNSRFVKNMCTSSSRTTLSKHEAESSEAWKAGLAKTFLAMDIGTSAFWKNNFRCRYTCEPQRLRFLGVYSEVEPRKLVHDPPMATSSASFCRLCCEGEANGLLGENSARLGRGG